MSDSNFVHENFVIRGVTEAERAGPLFHRQATTTMGLLM